MQTQFRHTALMMTCRTSVTAPPGLVKNPGSKHEGLLNAPQLISRRTETKIRSKTQSILFLTPPQSSRSPSVPDSHADPRAVSDSSPTPTSAMHVWKGLPNVGLQQTGTCLVYFPCGDWTSVSHRLCSPQAQPLWRGRKLFKQPADSGQGSTHEQKMGRNKTH